MMTKWPNRLWMVCAVLALMAGLAACPQVLPQEKNQLRTIRGTVVDKDESPAPASVVYLRNVKTEAVRTYIAEDNGGYHFSGLDPNVDYEVHAEKGDAVSPSRTVSSFDSRRDIQLTLKLSKKKSGG
jgi:hypothetical protein